MFTHAKITQRLHMRRFRQVNAALNVKKSASSFTQANVNAQQTCCRRFSCATNFLRISPGFTQAGLCHSHRIQSSLSHRGQSFWYSTDAEKRTDSTFGMSKDACPQGIQGDDCVTFKLWLENCRRYGLENCNDQLQGIQSGRKTLTEVIVEQDKLIADIAAQHRVSFQRHGYYSDRQGVQGSATPVNVDSPCPQGVQGYDCARFKLWLENCQRSGLQDCTRQFDNFKTGRKSLAEIFAEQDRLISEAATPAFHKRSKQLREYSTSTKNHEVKDSDKPESATELQEAQLTQRQKLKRAVKEYGSTVIVFHVAISLMSLGFFYLLVSSGIDVVGLLMKLEIGGALLQNKLAAGTGTFVVAYAVHKVFAPVRIATTLAATPFIVRYLRQIGFLKMPQHSKSK